MWAEEILLRKNWWSLMIGCQWGTRIKEETDAVSCFEFGWFQEWCFSGCEWMREGVEENNDETNFKFVEYDIAEYILV